MVFPYRLIYKCTEDDFRIFSTCWSRSSCPTGPTATDPEPERSARQNSIYVFFYIDTFSASV